MINYHEKLKHEYDMIWEGYLEKTDHREIRRNRKKGRKVYYDLIRKYIYHFANPKLLELGSGTGIDINVVSENNKSIEAFASDISEKSIRVGLKVASEFQNKIKFFVCDTLRLPLKDNTIHVIFSQGLVEHFRDPLAVITEQKRVLKKAGILIVNVPQKYTGYTLEKKRLMRSGKWQLGWESEFSYRDL
ncbi:class I SAM-dependent methyltransferase, partial [bacterium]|nr:class I SAM-dependent methyltransferase [bacterium]